jgi:molybdenum cofactor cytidylyltransferase
VAYPEPFRPETDSVADIERAYAPAHERPAVPAVISGVVLAGAGAPASGARASLGLRTQRALDALTSAGVGELVVVVTGDDADLIEGAIRLPPHGHFVRDTDHASGPASSLAAGLHALADDCEAAVVLLAEEPGVTDAEIRALVDAFERSRARIVRIAYIDGPGPALLSREIHAEAAHLHGDAGMPTLIASHPEWLEEVRVPFAAPAAVDPPVGPAPS